MMLQSADTQNTKFGRNAPCPCGSGRKYKKCCAANAATPGQGMDVGRFFAEADREHSQGNRDRAEQLLQAILTIEPNHAAALHRLGIVWVETGRAEQAVEAMRKAASLEPDSAAYHGDLGAALQTCGRREEAVLEYRQALLQNPDFVDTLANLGGNLRDLGQFEEAVALLERAVTLNNSHIGAQMNLGLTLLDLKRYTESKPCLERWIALEPGNHAAHRTLGNWYENQNLKRDAAQHYWRALQLKPDSFEAANNLGTCLSDGGYRADAMTLYRKALELVPDHSDVWSNLGVAANSMGDPLTALDCQNRALALDPTSAAARWNRSSCLLALGRLKQGWEDYEFRFEAHPDTRKRRPFPQPVWDGSDLSGKKILVWMEQGLGDEIFFASMIPDLLRAGAHCVLECERRLVTLFARSFPGAKVVPASDPPFTPTLQPDIDFQIPAGSLPRWLRPTIESFPKVRGYLAPDPVLIGRWKKRVAKLVEGPKVGICWRSSLHGGARSLQYPQLSQLAPLLRTPGIQFVNLQYDDCTRELSEAQRLFGTHIHVWDDMDLKNDQEGMAALISTLDLVVSAQTAVAEMAGAVGVPTWSMVRNTGVWNGLGQNYSPWQPSMQFWTCGANDPWEPMIEKIAVELVNTVSMFSRGGRSDP